LRNHAIDFATSIKYMLGYVAEPLPGDERFQGMLSIPYLTPAGVRAIKFRSLSTEGAKYNQHNGQKGRLYNAPAYFEAGTEIGISEGEMDAIAASEHLNVPTLGVPGTQGWKSAWRHVLEDFTMVYIFGDGDQPGRAFADEMAELVGWRARIIQCPEGEDVSSMAAKGREGELLRLMSTSKGDEA
jgi:DNA primase